MKSRRIMLALVLFFGFWNLAPSCQEVDAPEGGEIAEPDKEASGTALIKAHRSATPMPEATPLPPPPPLPTVYVGPWNLKAADARRFKAAGVQFDKKNYRRAAEAYETFIEAEPKHRDVPRAKFKLAECRFHLREFDEGVAVLTGFLASRPGLLWEARTHVELARLYPRLPGWGMRYDGALHYNQEHREGEYVQMWMEHREKNVTELEAADGELDVRVGPQGFDHARAAFAVVNGDSSDELQRG